ncbi:NAD(P)/FAD-dependent oxidoreductase [Haloechinothrix sp. LS1_15]|nr:NAD(P)/FAD-dependent oxidoreductase [Haloechinothrix sp. LS1_15]
MQEYDLVVLGGGAAGLAAASTGVRQGATTLLVTESPPGGDCTFTGCVPSKTVIEAAAAGLPFGRAMARAREVVARIGATEDESVLRARGIDVMRGHARLLSRDRIQVGTRVVRAPRMVLATGSAPMVPPIGNLADVPVLTTDTVFDLEAAPDSLAILGGGANGCELAQAFARLGIPVSLVESEGTLLPGTDPDVSALIGESLAADGVDVRVDAPVSSVHGDGQEITLTAGSATLSAQRLLVTTGRAPVTADLGLDAAGVATDHRGFVVVDRHLRTTVPGITAAGDVTGLSGHTHAAYAMGRVAATAALRRTRKPVFGTGAIPEVVFTTPEVATVGTFEHDVTDHRVRVAYLPMAEVDRAVTAGATTGFVKLIAGPRRGLGRLGGGKLLGATVVAERAGELISEATLAIDTGMFTGRLAQTIHPYPTWSIALQQAAAQFFGSHGGRTARRAGG